MSGINTTNNHRTGLSAQSTITGKQENVTSTGGILNTSGGGGGGGSGTNTNIYGNQTTSNTTAVQLSATSHALSNGLIIQALSTNVASVFIGASAVTTSTGFELQPGQATSIAVSNQNLPYVIGSNSTDGVCWIGN